jgi:two-component sensor histidine kinase/Tfp pilus assembly protein PilF
LVRLKTHIVFFLISFTVLGQYSFGQESLYKKLSKNNSDTTRLAAISDLAYSYIGKNNDSSYYYIQKGLEVCKEIEKNVETEKSDTSSLSHCGKLYMVLGYFHYKKIEFNESLRAFKKAEKLFDQVNELKNQAECLNNSAVILTKMSNNSEAILDYHKALKIYTQLNDSLGKAYTLNNLSRVYREQDDIDQAVKYIEESLELSIELNAKELETLNLNAYAGLNKIMGDTAAALKLYEQALSIRKSLKDSIGIATVLNNIGSLYKHKQKYKHAIDYFSSAQLITEKLNHLEGLGHTLYNQGEVYLAINDSGKALEFGLRALKIGDSVNNFKIIRRSAELLMDVYIKLNNWEKAFEMQSLKMEMDAKTFDIESQKIAQREALKYQFEKEKAIYRKEEEQEEKLREERAERQKIFYIAIGLVTLLLLALLFISAQRLRSAKQQNRLITKQSNERKLLLQEIHHRVKNNFQIVSSLLRLQSYSIDNEDLRRSFEEAVNRINSMSIVHDIIYRQETFSEIDSKDYLEKLVASLKQSSGNPKIDIEIDAQKPKLKIETLIHLGIALNELIINSFKYAFSSDHNDPKIRIFLNEIGDNEFELIYQDNGIGINKEIDQASFGMELIQTLIEHLEGSVNISSEEGWNTTISIKFKDI